jgi:protein transport protein SEC61 subunit gamma-like protein
MIEKLSPFLLQCRRVWAVLKKPTMEDVKSVSKITAIGLLAIGFIGFLISILMNMF